MDADLPLNTVPSALHTQNRVEILHSVDHYSDNDPDAMLHFQKVIYHLSDGGISWDEHGFRFMWSYMGRLCGHRGQARIPDATVMFKLITAAILEGWFTLPKCISINMQ